jgi:predicted peroxiredoxin
MAGVVCNEKEERLVGKIRIVPWKTFLAKLWAREYL